MEDKMHNGYVQMALAANRRYLPGLKATIASIICASKSKKILFHVFSDELTDADHDEICQLVRRFGYDEDIHFIRPDMERFLSSFKQYNGSCTPYLRLFFAEFFPNLSWVLWSDVDVLWFRDPEELWTQKDSGFSILWARDRELSQKKGAEFARARWRPDFDWRKYCCSGVCMLNLEKMRRRSFAMQSLDFVARWGSPPFADQDILNELCYDDAKIVDDCWDLMNPRRVGSEIVLHFNGIGQHWNGKPYAWRWPLYEIWFRYYAQVVEGRRKARIYSPWNSVLMFFAGLAYLPDWLLKIMVARLSSSRAVDVRLFFFFAWVRRKKLW